MIPLPNITDLIHYMLSNASDWFAAFLPFVGMIVGISALGILGNAFVDYFWGFSETEKKLNPQIVFLNYNQPMYAQNPLIGKTHEQLVEAHSGFRSGDREKFDRAMINNDKEIVLKMLPTIPLEYKNRFKDRIKNIID